MGYLALEQSGNKEEEREEEKEEDKEEEEEEEEEGNESNTCWTRVLQNTYPVRTEH